MMMKHSLNSSNPTAQSRRWAMEGSRECAQALTCVDDVTFDVLPQYQTHTHAGEALFTLFLLATS